MTNIEEVLKYVYTTLTEKCKSCTFVYNYPEQITEFPISTSVVSIGIKEATVPLNQSCFLGEDSSGNSYYGSVVSCAIELKICVPKLSAGMRCYKVFDNIAAACMYLNGVDLISLTCGTISYDRIMGALVLEGEIRLNADLRTVKK